MTGPFGIEIIELDSMPEGEALIVSPPLLQRDDEDPRLYRLNPRRMAKIVGIAGEAEAS
ncbi:hypothetical protein [Actinomadura formosensis]|uniref:hypothetical protein n=1 Tax=Actinomadura formosensis TaxID=60706 RepID=UPI003D89C5A9